MEECSDADAHKGAPQSVQRHAGKQSGNVRRGNKTGKSEIITSTCTSSSSQRNDNEVTDPTFPTTGTNSATKDSVATDNLVNRGVGIRSNGLPDADDSGDSGDASRASAEHNGDNQKTSGRLDADFCIVYNDCNMVSKLNCIDYDVVW